MITISLYAPSDPCHYYSPKGQKIVYQSQYIKLMSWARPFLLEGKETFLSKVSQIQSWDCTDIGNCAMQKGLLHFLVLFFIDDRAGTEFAGTICA